MSPPLPLKEVPVNRHRLNAARIIHFRDVLPVACRMMRLRLAGDQLVNPLPYQRQQIVLDEILIPSVLETLG